jgi:acetate kinase
MTDTILVLNAGSSSIKFSLFIDQGPSPSLTVRGQLEGLYTAPRFAARSADGALLAERTWPAGERLGHEGALAHLEQFLAAQGSDQHLVAVGHRVVHGGTQYAAPVRVDAQILADLEALIPLAPLHQPHNLAPIRILLSRRPGLPHVACFDTAFHSSQPPVAQTFALPAWVTERGVRRYGFHGLSYEYVMSVLPAYDPQAAAGRVAILHLGNGASMCAVQSGKSVASTMGFTPVEGLPMGTRCGNLDPGVLLYLMNELRLDAPAIEQMIYHESGLLGVSGVSSDMRALLASTDPRARLAVDLFVYRIGRELGSLAAALGGLDALVFTAGIGEGSAEIRARVCTAAAWLGVELDARANAVGGPRLSLPSSRVSAWVIPTNEAQMIARHTCRNLAKDRVRG